MAKQTRLSFKQSHPRAQGMVEFALALPVFLLLVFGAIEFGRLLMTFSAVFSAAREAARYGAAVGIGANGVSYDHDCAGMKAAAVRVGGLGGVQATQVAISMVNQAGTEDLTWCTTDNSGKFTKLGDLIVVKVNTNFWSIMPIVNLPNLPVRSSSSRTIVKDVEVLAPASASSVGNPVPWVLTINYVTCPTCSITSSHAGLGRTGGTFADGTVVDLIIKLDNNYGFIGWEGDPVIGNADVGYTIKMDGNKTITAKFSTCGLTLAYISNTSSQAIWLVTVTGSQRVIFETLTTSWDSPANKAKLTSIKLNSDTLTYTGGLDAGSEAVFTATFFSITPNSSLVLGFVPADVNNIPTITNFTCILPQ